MKIKILMLFVFSFFLSFVALSREVKRDLIITGLKIPWGMTFVSQHQILVTSRSGEIHLVDVKNKKIIKTWKNEFQIFRRSQGGLLDVKAHPNFDKNRTVFFTFSKEVSGGSTTALARAIFPANLSGFSDKKIIFEGITESRTGYHYGSRIAFDNQGSLFLSIGDRGERSLAQSQKHHNGKILKFNSTEIFGEVILAQNKKAYTLGHRNPQGLFFLKETKELWSHEHGPRGGDEINLIKEGRNYGWPEVGHGKEYSSSSFVGDHRSKRGFEDGIKVYVPSIAPSGLAVWRSDKEKKTIFALGSLVLKHLNIVVKNDDGKMTEKRFFEGEERIRNVTLSPQGHLVYSTDKGELFQVTSLAKDIPLPQEN